MIICSSQDEEKSPIISKLHLYRRPYPVPTELAEYKVYLEKHFVDEAQPSYQQVMEMESMPYFSASVVDHNGYSL